MSARHERGLKMVDVRLTVDRGFRVSRRVPEDVAEHIANLRTEQLRAEQRTALLASELRAYCDRYDAGDLPCIEARQSFERALHVVGRPGPVPPPAPPPAPPIRRVKDNGPGNTERENRVGMWSFVAGIVLSTIATLLFFGLIP